MRGLFDSKADTWSLKYVGGPLSPRIERFGQALEARVPRGQRVLDLGCGAGDISIALAARGYVMVGCDFSPRMIAHARTNADAAGQSVEWIELPADWSRLPLANASFDAIVASSVLEYVPDLTLVLGECERLLKQGGWFICTVPNVRHPTRRLERMALWLLELLAAERWSDRLARMKRYFAYLRGSLNRFTLPEWRQVASDAGLELAAVADAKSSLLLLELHKRRASSR